MGGLCRARISDAGLSLETATSRTCLAGFGDCAAAVLIRAVTAERFAINAEVRAGVATMLGTWSTGVVMAVKCLAKEDKKNNCSSIAPLYIFIFEIAELHFLL